MDGLKVESLPPVGMPMVADVEQLANFDVPASLEEQGDPLAARMAWRDLLHDTRHSSKDFTKASLGFGAFLERQKDTATAQRVYMALGEAFPPAYEAWARAAALDDGTHVAAIAARLQEGGDACEWCAEGLYNLVWNEAARGAVTETYGLLRAKALHERLAPLDARLAKREKVAFWLGLLPGFGHAYLGDARTAAAIVPLFSLFAWALLFALRRREWPYAAIWALVLAMLWFNSPVSAQKAAVASNKLIRREAFASWVDLQPRWPAPPPAKVGFRLPPSVMGTAPVSATLLVPGHVSATVKGVPTSLPVSASVIKAPLAASATMPSAQGKR